MEVSDIAKIYSIALGLYYIGLVLFLAKDQSKAVLINDGNGSEVTETRQQVVSANDIETVEAIPQEQMEKRETEFDLTEAAGYDQDHDTNLENMVEIDGEVIAAEAPPMNSYVGMQEVGDEAEHSEEVEVSNETEGMPDDEMDQDEDDGLDEDEILNADQ